MTAESAETAEGAQRKSDWVRRIKFARKSTISKHLGLQCSTTVTKKAKSRTKPTTLRYARGQASTLRKTRENQNLFTADLR